MEGVVTLEEYFWIFSGDKNTWDWGSHGSRPPSRPRLFGERGWNKHSFSRCAGMSARSLFAPQHAPELATAIDLCLVSRAACRVDRQTSRICWFWSRWWVNRNSERRIRAEMFNTKTADTQIEKIRRRDKDEWIRNELAWIEAGPNVFTGKDKPSKVGDNKTGFLPGLSDAEDFELAPGKAEAGGHL